MMYATSNLRETDRTQLHDIYLSVNMNTTVGFRESFDQAR